jgi:undecaprenyl diphosphate synthase
MIYKEQLDLKKLPRHIAIIMDGNGRWAKQKGSPRVFGHKNGVKAVRDTVEGAAELGIEFLTLFAFSTENWMRPRTEIDALMSLLVASINKETKTLLTNNIRLRTIGDIESLPATVAQHLREAVDKTKKNTGLNLVLALSYSSHREMLRAVQSIAVDIEQGKLDSSIIDKNIFETYLYTSGFPDPELLIRTSGEYRLSNFLLWQIAYTELYFTPTLWPDFRREHLYQAIADYQLRERRFGKISEQIAENINLNRGLRDA